MSAVNSVVEGGGENQSLWNARGASVRFGQIVLDGDQGFSLMDKAEEEFAELWMEMTLIV